jgi:hypothetical protein
VVREELVEEWVEAVVESRLVRGGKRGREKKMHSMVDVVPKSQATL